MRFAMLLAASVALAGCSMGQDMSATDSAVADFHAKLNNSQFAAIAAAAGPEIKNGGTDFPAVIGRIHAKLGTFRSTSRQGFNDNINNGDHTFTTSYASVYSSGPATENFVFRLNGGKPMLIGYHVESAALLK
ncbi:MAG TPA: hypothetical protein VF485_08240 [Sphingomonas sp.]